MSEELCPNCKQPLYGSEIDGAKEHGWNRTLHIMFCSECGYWKPTID